MNNSPSRTQLIAHIASLAAKSKTEDSDVLFFKGGVYKGEWNPNTIANQLPANTEADDIFLVSENGSYFGRTLVVGELVRFVGIHDPVLVYSKYIPIPFILSMLNDEAPPTNTSSGFSFGGEWDATPTLIMQIAEFDELQNATINESTFTPINAGGSYAYARNIKQQNNFSAQIKFLWPSVVNVGDSFTIGFGSPTNTAVFNDFLNPSLATSFMGIGKQAGTDLKVQKFGQTAPQITPTGLVNQAGDEILIDLNLVTLQFSVTNITQNNVLLMNESGNGQANFLAPFVLVIASTVSVDFDIANTAQPVMQELTGVNIPEDADGKTYLVMAATENSIVDSKLLKADDFVTFYNDAQNIIVSRLYTDEQIKLLADMAIQNSLEVDGAIYNAIQSAVNP